MLACPHFRIKHVSGGYNWKCSALHERTEGTGCLGGSKLHVAHVVHVAHVAHVAQAIHGCRLADAITLNGAIMSCRQSKKWAEAVCALVVGLQGVTLR